MIEVVIDGKYDYKRKGVCRRARVPIAMRVGERRPGRLKMNLEMSHGQAAIYVQYMY